MNGQKKVHPPMCTRKFKYGNTKKVDQYIEHSPSYPDSHVVGKPVKFTPIRDILGETLLRFQLETKVVIVNILGLPHHGEKIFCMVWAMWVLRCIRIGMMHSVQNCIGPWREIRTSLPNPGEEVKEFFPILAHHKHLMSRIPV
jgi:hypothetical protein